MKSALETLKRAVNAVRNFFLLKIKNIDAGGDAKLTIIFVRPDVNLEQ